MADLNAVVPLLLDSAGTLDGDEEFHVVDDPSGTPTSKKTTPDAIVTLAGSTFLKLDASNDPITESLQIDAEQVRVNNSAVNEAAGLRLDNDAQGFSIRVDGASSDRLEIVDLTNASTPFRIEPASPSGANHNALVIDSGGLVGIGTESPAADFHLESSGNPILRVESSGAGAVNLHMVNTAGEWRLQVLASGVFRLRDANAASNPITVEEAVPTNTLYLDSPGNVGIGTSSPAAKLDVDQASATAATPVVKLTQADVSEEMVEFDTTIGTGNAIEAIAAKTLTTTHLIKVTIPGGLTRYIPCGTIA